LRFSGRFRVTIRIGPSRSTSTAGGDDDTGLLRAGWRRQVVPERRALSNGRGAAAGVPERARSGPRDMLRARAQPRVFVPMSYAESRDASRDAPRRPHERVIARLDAAGTHATWVLWASLAGMFATTFPITILTVSLVPIAHEFGAHETTMAWVISAPMLFSAVTMPLLGKLGDLYGHRRAFLIGTAGSTAIAFATAFAWDATSLIAMRTLAAVLGGATQPSAMALIFSVTASNRRVQAMGWWSMTTAGAPALGLVAGGPLVEWFGWRIVFVLQGVFALAAFALAALVLRETARKRVRLDVAGTLALAIGVGGLMLALA